MSNINNVVTWYDEIDKWLSDAKNAQIIETEMKKAFLTKTKKKWLVKKAEIINGIKAWSEANDPLTESDKVWLAEIKELIYAKEEALWLANKAWIEEAENAWLQDN